MSSPEIITFGCRLNIYESEVIKEVSNKAASNSIIFNTCAVTKEAERQARQAIRAAKRKNPDMKIIVTGCAAQLNPSQFADMPEVDLVIGNEEKLKSESYILQNLNDNAEKIFVNDIMSVKETAGHLITSFEGRVRAFVQIQNGCNHRCTFCTIPFARGNSRSVPVGEIVTQVKKLLDIGYKEIVLTGVDISDYGLDLPGQPSLANMIKRLFKFVPNLLRLRLSSIDVAEIDEELLELIAHDQKIMPHIHISLQAGDNMILKRMKRRHNREMVIEFCQTLKKIRPNIAFGADIIAGFPTETEEMFRNSLELVTEASLQYLHVFPYSEREGTPAARMPQIEKKIRKERAAMLREAGNNELNKFLNSQINTHVKVLMETEKQGRAENFTQVILNNSFNVGNLIDATIIGIENGNLIAKTN
ncbi:MAG: tRNA (N(6)-L-threonylcarbamoyladenosine(37)-C(2))-methylthiotransferase MtaB [Alphaproteobacteria bacterium]